MLPLLPRALSGVWLLAAERSRAGSLIVVGRLIPNGGKGVIRKPGCEERIGKRKSNRTEPEAFFIDVFFNIPPTSKLAPTRIAYAGGQAEFAVDMSAEHSTRLIVFHGGFQSLFVAIYGELAVANAHEVRTVYEEKVLPTSAPIPLSSNVDPGCATKPTSLAEQLLNLMNEPPTLSIATRLVFSLKPEKDDWDHPDFPYLYSDLEVHEDYTIQDLVQSAERPIRDDIPSELLSVFAMAVHDSLKSQSRNEAYLVAKLLSITASQQTRFAEKLLEHLDLPQIFNEDTLDEDIVHWLKDAAANIEIARYFSEDKPFLLSLEDISSGPKTEKTVQRAIKKLLARVRGWQSFEDALINPDGDFVGSAAFLKDITTIEHSLGCWLECMITHDTLVSRLAQAPSPEPRSLPPLLFQSGSENVSHTDFIVFVRAILGVASVLAALAWADSMGNVQCRERALALLVLWQGIDGYREIVNHCLLLHQMTQRLGWNKSDEVPRNFGIFAERLLVGLANDPQAMLSEDLYSTILALEPPFSFITQEELMEMRKIASVAQDGLWSAVEEIAYESVRPFSLRRLRVLRASLAIVKEELSYDKGEWRVLTIFWDEQNRGMLPTLISLLVDIAEDLSNHFVLNPIPRVNQALSDLLLRTANETMHLISSFTPTYPLSSHELSPLVNAVCDIYAHALSASLTFSQSSAAHLAARNIVKSCPSVLRDLIGPNYDEPTVPNPCMVLKALFENPTLVTNRDPVHHLSSVYALFNSILPEGTSSEESSYWIFEVLMKMLPDLKKFSDLLEPKMKAAFIQRISTLDNGEAGLGEWLVLEELRNLSTTLHQTFSVTTQDEYAEILRYQLSVSFDFCHLLMSTMTQWALTSLTANNDLSQVLETCLSFILDCGIKICSPSFTKFLQAFAAQREHFNLDMQFAILLLLLRDAQANPTSQDALHFVIEFLRGIPVSSLSIQQLQNEVGRTISAYSDHASSIKKDGAETVLQILEWMSSQEDAKLHTLGGLSLEAFNYLCVTLSVLLPPDRQTDLASVKNLLNIDEDQIFPLPTIELPQALVVPLSSLESLLSPKPFEPSTPKSGNKTPDILGVVISPPTALLRSPAATGLTKTYANNDFRQLRALSSTRLNTSRLPSTHGENLNTRLNHLSC
ncbi:hypothetical protein CPC08DRAFT_740271 [Agrocybe pediades]|nr:hypothetical protein CPC08DRAFT_740271 [Agrocybe pediades]